MQHIVTSHLDYKEVIKADIDSSKGSLANFINPQVNFYCFEKNLFFVYFSFLYFLTTAPTENFVVSVS